MAGKKETKITDELVNAIQNKDRTILNKNRDKNRKNRPAAVPAEVPVEVPAAGPAAVPKKHRKKKHRKNRPESAVPAAVPAAVPKKNGKNRPEAAEAGRNKVPVQKKKRPEVNQEDILDEKRERAKRFNLNRRAPKTDNQSRRSRALYQVRMAQRHSAEDVFYKAPFRYLVIQIAQTLNRSEFRYTAESLKFLQEIIEADVIRLLEIAQLASAHARPGRGVVDSRPKVLRSDIDFSYRMKFGNHIGDTGLNEVKEY